MSNAVYFLKMVHSGADETTEEYLDIIKHEIDNSLRIITDLLDFARTKTAQLQTVAVRALIDESLGKCTIPKNIELINKLPELLPNLNVDPQQIGQVLHNLIMNAIQAMPAGGLLSLHGRQDDGMVRLQIADTGEGISPENMKKLFQPLFTTKAKGIGLGLVVCRNLTEANGGRIEVSGEPGRGTTFTVILPVRKPLAEGNSKV
jgi:signal transduction histidine kinase